MTTRRSKITQVVLGVLLLVQLVFLNIGTVLAQDPSPADNAFAMPYESYFIAGDCHSDGWGTQCAVDVNNSIDGGPLLSTIYGTVVAKGSNDNYGNPFLVIENARWKVYYLHGIYDLVETGSQVVLGQQIGTEASIGRSTGAHTHLSVYDKVAGRWVDPRNILTGNNTLVSGEGLSYDSSPNPQPPGEVDWNTGVVGEYRIEALTVVWSGVEVDSAESETAGVSQETSEQQLEATTAQQTQGQSGFLRTIPPVVWIFLMLLCAFLSVNRDSRPWWPFWLVLFVLFFVALLWSRSSVPAQLNIPSENTPTTSDGTEVADLGEGEEIIFPAIPEPIVEAIENNPPITVPQGSEYFPDPGPTMARTVEIVWQVAEERGIPPQFLLAKLYYEGGYMWNERWMGLRNWKPDGSMTRSYSYADCRGIGQVCKYYHPAFDQDRAGDLTNPEAALYYSTSFAADFIVQLFNETGDWSSVVMRYHGTQEEGSKGLQFTRNFITSPPINPETGQPAWPAASIKIMSETSLR